MEHFNQKICRLELNCLMGINMINNNHMVKVTTIKYYINNSVSCKHNKYFNKRIIPLKYFFNLRYEEGFTADIPFEVNLLWWQYD